MLCYFLWYIRNYQLWTVCYGCSVAAVQIEEIGNRIVVIVEHKAHANLRQAAVGCQLVDIARAIDQIKAVNVTDQIGGDNRRPIGATSRRLEISDFKIGGCTKEAILDIKQATIETGVGVAATKDALLFDFEDHAKDAGAIRNDAGIEG